jgi:hypothetical protein
MCAISDLYRIFWNTEAPFVYFLARRLLESRFSRLRRKAHMIERPIYIEGGKGSGFLGI